MAKLLELTVTTEPLPLQTVVADTVEKLLTSGNTFTVTVILVALPAQLPPVEVGVTAYTIEPAVVVLGLVSVCAMVEPEVALAPVILPVLVPNVQAKLLAADAVKPMLVALPVQTDAVLAVVTAGIGLTVTVILVAVPTQLPVVAVGVTI